MDKRRANSRMGLIVPALAVLALLPAAVASTASAADYHVDCQAPSAGDGSEASPFNSLAAAGSVVLGAGDGLLLKRGSACSGQLVPQGGGTEAGPVTVGAYGTGPAPRVVGTGTNAVLLADLSNLIVEDLDISNPGAGEPLGESTTLRNGLMVTATSGTVRNLTLRRLTVHDVAGDLTKNPQGSAAIQVSTFGPPPDRFENLSIEGNTITNVSRSAISITGTLDPNRPDAAEPWPDASHGLVVRDNRIDMIAGDGIVPRGTDGALVEGNVVSRGNQSGRGPFDPGGALCNAGIWAFRANNTLIQKNEVFEMEFNGCDGTGFDVDYFQDGTLIQHNFSHDNAGGFVLLCSDEEDRFGDVRFNLSVNDGATIAHGPCGIEEGVVGTLSGLRFFNNTVVAARPSTTILGSPAGEMLLPGDFEFRNNILYATGPASPAMACGDRCSYNEFFGMPASGTSAVTADPQLLKPFATGSGFAVAQNFRLGDGSPARQAGTPVANPGSSDFFGRTIDPIAPPSIGFDQPPPRPVVQPPPVDRSKCRKATVLQRRAIRRLRTARRKVKRLVRNGAKRVRIRRAKHRVRFLKRQVVKRKRARRIACRISQ